MHERTSQRGAGASTVPVTSAAGQFLMALDSSVMNAAIATVAEDVGTTVTGIQTPITLDTLVMAMLPPRHASGTACLPALVAARPCAWRRTRPTPCTTC
jgi:hypothetical protein